MLSEQRMDVEAPSYIRWGLEQSAHAIELRLELVGIISRELERAMPADIEIGGVLIGRVLKDSAIATLRIDDIEIIPRRPEDGAIYMLGPDYQKRFPEVRAAAKARHKAPIGFFRSHCRSGPLRPALADRTLLKAEFKDSTYAFLLIEAREPYKAAFFIAERGELPNEPAVREFRFNEAEFKALPEIEAEDIGVAVEPEAGPRAGSNWYVWGAAIAAMVIVLALWLGAGRPPISHWLQPASQQIDLKLAARRDILKISWNHDARPIGPASSATLTIADGPSRREIKLGADELKIGNVDYDSGGRPVLVTMSIRNGNSTPVTQTATWPSK